MPSVKLSSTHIESIVQNLAEPIAVNGLINNSNEEQRLAFLFEDSNDLYNVISHVLFNKAYDIDEELSTDQLNEFNLYRLFFEGIGDRHFYFNESSLIEDIRESVTLNDYCQRDQAYQQKMMAIECENYEQKPYIFSCDYWVRYINNAHELVYATVRSADMDLYWQLEELSLQLVDQAIPHSIDMKELDVSKYKEDVLSEVIVNAKGKEQQLAKLQEFCRTCINDLTTTYAKKIVNDAPSISIRFEVDECTEQYFIFVVNNEKAAKKIHLRDFERCFTKFEIPKQNIHQQHERYLDKFKCLFTEKIKMLNKESEE